MIGTKSIEVCFRQQINNIKNPDIPKPKNT